MAQAVYDDQDNKEKSFGAPDKDDKSLSPGELAALDQIEAGLKDDVTDGGSDSKTATSDELQSAEENTGGNEIPYSEEKKTFKQKVSSVVTKKRLVGGGIAGIVIGGAFGIFTITSGPLQFIHAAQLLQQFHFGEQEDFFERRMSKMYRYFKWKNKPQNQRLGKLGNFLADKIETKFNKSGMTTDFDEFGKLKGVTFDVETARANGIDLDEIKNEFGSSEFSDIETRRRFVQVEFEGKFTTSLKERRFIKSVRRSLGISGLGSYMQARLHTRRLGIPLHPIRYIDERVNEKLRAEWQKRKSTLIKTGEKLQIKGAVDEDEDNKSPSDSDNERAAAEVEEIGNSADDLSGEAHIAETKTKLRAKLRAAGAVSAIIGVVCMIKGLADGAEAIEQSQIIEVSQRIGGYMMGLGGQVMSGQDIDLVQLGFENEAMFDESRDQNPNTKPNSFFSDNSIKAESGQRQDGVDPAKSTQVGGATNAFSALVGSFPFLGTACTAANSIIGQAVQIGIDLASGVVSGGLSTAGGFLVGELLGPYFNDLARWIAREFIPWDIAGAALGGVANQGAFFMANQSFLTMGATELSSGERAELKQQTREWQNTVASERPWTERYLSPTNANSLLAKAIDSYQGSSNVASIFSLPSSIFGNISQAFNARAFATSNYDYKVPKFAFRPSENEQFDSDESYSNPYENARILGPQRIQAFNKMFSEKCFGVTFDSQERFKASKAVDMRDYPDECQSTDPAFVRYRLYIGDLMTFATAACYEGDESVCAEIGFGDSMTAPTTSVDNKNLYLIGDSLTVGMKSAGLDEGLIAKGYKPTTDGLVSRGLVGGAQPDGLTKIEEDNTLVQDAGTIVVALGTNDSVESLEEELGQVLNKIRTWTTAQIYWVNYVGANSAEAAQKEKSDILAAWAAKNNIKVIDWASVGAQYVAEDTSYGVHPYSNYDKLVQTVVSSLPGA